MGCSPRCSCSWQGLGGFCPIPQAGNCAWIARKIRELCLDWMSSRELCLDSKGNEGIVPGLSGNCAGFPGNCAWIGWAAGNCAGLSGYCAWIGWKSGNCAWIPRGSRELCLDSKENQGIVPGFPGHCAGLPVQVLSPALLAPRLT